MSFFQFFLSFTWTLQLWPKHLWVICLLTYWNFTRWLRQFRCAIFFPIVLPFLASFHLHSFVSRILAISRLPVTFGHPLLLGLLPSHSASWTTLSRWPLLAYKSFLMVPLRIRLNLMTYIIFLTIVILMAIIWDLNLKDIMQISFSESTLTPKIFFKKSNWNYVVKKWLVFDDNFVPVGVEIAKKWLTSQ